MTARYRTIGSNTWIYYASGGRRDHAIVVSPKGARNINLYEINTLNIDASGDQMRSAAPLPTCITTRNAGISIT